MMKHIFRRKSVYVITAASLVTILAIVLPSLMNAVPTEAQINTQRARVQIDGSTISVLTFVTNNLMTNDMPKLLRVQVPILITGGLDTTLAKRINAEPSNVIVAEPSSFRASNIPELQKDADGNVTSVDFKSVHLQVGDVSFKNLVRDLRFNDCAIGEYIIGTFASETRIFDPNKVAYIEEITFVCRSVEINK